MEDYSYYKEFADISFLQKESVNHMVVHTRKTFNPNCLHLDSCSSFHQDFREEHVKDLDKVSITLCAGCNTGSSYSNKKG